MRGRRRPASPPPRAPSATRSAARPGVRFQAVTSNPARRRLAAIAAPIVPSPTNPIRSTRHLLLAPSVPSRRGLPSRAMSWLGIDLRRMGTGLLVFGVVGMIVAGIVAVGLAAGAIAARNLDERVAADQARLVHDPPAGRRDDGAGPSRPSATRATTLTTTSETIGSAGDVLGPCRRHVRGAQPVARRQHPRVTRRCRAPPRGSASSPSTPGRSRTRPTRLATNLGVNAGDTGALADPWSELRTEVSSLESRVVVVRGRPAQLVSYLVGGILLLEPARRLARGRGRGLRVVRLPAPPPRAARWPRPAESPTPGPR